MRVARGRVSREEALASERVEGVISLGGVGGISLGETASSLSTDFRSVPWNSLEFRFRSRSFLSRSRSPLSTTAATPAICSAVKPSAANSAIMEAVIFIPILMLCFALTHNGLDS
jgi:hypothetical protein